MRYHRRIHTIYSKELIDILRDHRTLIAMVVVPIVLYPLLMLGSVQAVSFQAAGIEEEALVVAVINENQGQNLKKLVDADRAALRRGPSVEHSKSISNDEPKPIEEDKLQISLAGSVEEVDRLIRERRVHIGVVFDRDELFDAPNVQNKVQWRYDKEDVRSAAAKIRLEEMIARVKQRTVDERKAAARLPETFDEPFAIETVDLSSPPSILGQILPLILVLMTITGAIYPAIDLTAGERERGTLESLMASPVPVIDLIVGKFLVVTTVALMGAALNLASVTATVYFGGFGQLIASTGGSMPMGTMFFILLALVPFAVLMSAIMIAVCSFARTFKEAQNYVTPVILAVLIPGGIAALPATRLEGVMLVMPVGNMVLLAGTCCWERTFPAGLCSS
jgi:ABC-2 type transport system permease protein/sodium transport system permease protein